MLLNEGLVRLKSTPNSWQKEKLGDSENGNTHRNFMSIFEELVSTFNKIGFMV
jgi:hypothetical protein